MTMTLAECPIGLFFSASGELCLKTEYGSNEGRIDAYIVSSGEFFWGSWPQTIESQRAQIVRPVDAAALTAALEGREEPSQDYRLPCDVRLPPYTTIRKGCTLDTLMLSLGQREGRPSSDTTFPPPPRSRQAARGGQGSTFEAVHHAGHRNRRQIVCIAGSNMGPRGLSS